MSNNPPQPAVRNFYVPASLSVAVRCKDDKQPLSGLFIIWKLVPPPPAPAGNAGEPAGASGNSAAASPTGEEEGSKSFALGIVDKSGFLEPVHDDANPWRDVFLSSDPHTFKLSETQKYKACLLRHPVPAVARSLRDYLNGKENPDFASWGPKDELLVDLPVARETVKGGKQQFVIELEHKPDLYWPKGHGNYDRWTLYRDMPHALCDPVKTAIRRAQVHMAALRYPIGIQEYPYIPEIPGAAIPERGLSRLACCVAGFQTHASGNKVFKVADRKLAHGTLVGAAAPYPEQPFPAKRNIETWAYLIGKEENTEPSPSPPHFTPGFLDSSTASAIGIWLENGYRKPGKILLGLPVGEDNQVYGICMREDGAFQVEVWRELVRTFGCSYSLRSGHAYRDILDMGTGAGILFTSIHKTGLAIDFSMDSIRLPNGKKDTDYTHAAPEWPIRFEAHWIADQKTRLKTVEKRIAELRPKLEKAKETRTKDVENQDKLGTEVPEPPKPLPGETEPEADPAPPAAAPPAAPGAPADSEDAAKATKAAGQRAEKARETAKKKLKTFGEKQKDYAKAEKDYATASEKADAAEAAATAEPTSAKNKNAFDKAADRKKAYAKAVSAWKAALKAHGEASTACEDAVSADDAYIQAIETEISLLEAERDAIKRESARDKSGYSVRWRLYGHSDLDVFGGDDGGFQEFLKRIRQFPAKVEETFIARVGASLKSQAQEWLKNSAPVYLDYAKIAAALEKEMVEDKEKGRPAFTKKYFRSWIRPFIYDPFQVDGGTVRKKILVASSDDYDRPAFPGESKFRGQPKSFINLTVLGQLCGMYRIGTAGMDWKYGWKEFPVLPQKGDRTANLRTLASLIEIMPKHPDTANEPIRIFRKPVITRMPSKIDTKFMTSWADELKQLIGKKGAAISFLPPQITFEMPGTTDLEAGIKPALDLLSGTFGSKQFLVVSAGSDSCVAELSGTIKKGSDLAAEVRKGFPDFQKKVKEGNPKSKPKKKEQWSVTIQPIFDPESASGTPKNVAFTPADAVQVRSEGFPRTMEWWHYQSRFARGVPWGELLEALGYVPDFLAPETDLPKKSSAAALQEPPTTEEGNGTDGRRVGYHPEHLNDTNGGMADPSEVENPQDIPGD